MWKPDADTTLHAGYSRYFTPPLMELISGEQISKFAGTTGYPAGYTPASPPLDGPILPERSDYFDVGADHVFLPGLKFGVDGFYKLAHNLIDEGQFGAPIILSIFNYGKANTYGVEFTGSFNRGPWAIYGNLSVGRERATDVTSQQFNFSPADLAYIASNYIYTDHSQWVTASGGIAYTWLGTRFSADMLYGSGLRQDSASGVPNGSSVPPYVQVNFGVSHRFNDAPGGPIELSLNLINGFDQIYEIRSGSGVGVFAAQYGPRQTVFAGRAEVLLSGTIRNHNLDRLNETVAMLQAGGIAVYPLVALAMLAAVIIIEKGFVLSARTRLPARLIALIETYDFGWNDLAAQIDTLDSRNHFARFLRVILDNRAHQAWWVEIARRRRGEPYRKVAGPVALDSRNDRHRRAAPGPSGHDYRHDPILQALRRSGSGRPDGGDRRCRGGIDRDRAGFIRGASGALRVQLLFRPSGKDHGRDGAPGYASHRSHPAGCGR